MNIAIVNGKVIDPSQNLDKTTSVFISNGKIIKYDNPPNDFTCNKTIDAKGCLVIPGLVDIFSQARGIKNTNTSFLQKESKAIAKAGITTTICSPDGTPIIDSVEQTQRMMQSTENLGVKIHPIGALTTGLNGEDVTNLSALKKEGCIAFSNCLHPIQNLKTLRACYDLASTFNCKIIIQPLEPSLGKDGIIHEFCASIDITAILMAIPFVT